MFLVSSVSDVEAVLDDYRRGRLIDPHRMNDVSAGEGETPILASRCG
jgi:hypothetical protein